ncbi:hypothetical protein, partial [Streptomyces sp. HUCO-GS316]|uniref:hypothetical protein n=1 Tax=Streptomyces sp. HUCO-GS316 TaxID=2692198 RepID=UPI001925D5E3
MDPGRLRGGLRRQRQQPQAAEPPGDVVEGIPVMLREREHMPQFHPPGRGRTGARSGPDRRGPGRRTRPGREVQGAERLGEPAGGQ